MTTTTAKPDVWRRGPPYAGSPSIPLGREKQLPSNLEAERATLGSLLMARDAIVAVAAMLEPWHFYLEKHRWVYEAMRACYDRRVPPDLMTIAEELRRREQLVEVGDVTGLVELADSVPTAYHVEHYARIVIRCAVLRRLIEAGGKIAAMGFDESDDDEQMIVARAQAELQDLANTQQQSGLFTLGQVLDEIYEMLNDPTPPGIPTGLAGLDALTGGWHGQDLNIIAARPGVGKTSVALWLALFLAKHGRRVHILSREMGHTQLGQRLLANVANIDSSRFRHGHWPQSDINRIVDAMGGMYDYRDNIIIDEGVNPTIEGFYQRIMQRAGDYGYADLYIIDYLQLMDATKRSRDQNRQQDVSIVARGLKEMARQLDRPFIALSQLNRAIENRKDGIPNLSDLRESGELEQAADFVAFLYAMDVSVSEMATDEIIRFDIQKNRHGPNNVILNLRVDRATNEWRELAPASMVAAYDPGYGSAPGYGS